MQVNDYGTTLILTIKEGNSPLNISGATTLEIVFDRPNDNGETTKTADFVTDGKDGKIKYIIESNLLDTPGEWKIQVVLTFANAKWHSDIGVFDVVENL